MPSRRPASSSNKPSVGKRSSKSVNAEQIYLSTLRGRSVWSEDGRKLGALWDFLVRLGETEHPAIHALVVRSNRKNLRLAIGASGFKVDGEGIHLSTREEPEVLFERKAGEIRIYQDLVDHEVIDRSAVKVIRINDIVVGWRKGKPAIEGIDASGAGLLRRLLPQRWSGDVKGDFLDWSTIEPIAGVIPEAEEQSPCPSLARLHPSDVAKLMDNLPFRSGSTLLCGLDDEAAADALEEVERRRQPEILDYLPKDRAIAILNRMAPDAAADLLQELPRETSDRLIRQLNPETSADIRLLLSYPQETAGGLMTTDFVFALERETVREATTYLKGQLRKPDLIYYVYIVDSATERRLKGVISLRDLLLAKPSQPLRSFLGETVMSVAPETHSKEVARIMGEYNLLALPIVDDNGRMLGLVTADDVLDLILPEALRQHVPKLFS